MSGRILQVEVVKCPIRKEDIGKSSAGVDESDVVNDPPESQPVDHNKVSDSAEIEVSTVPIPDITIYAGREDLLAICSTCSDGAEHIYCMREKLNKIPEGDWMCEECILNEENKRDVLQKFEKAAARVSSQPSLNTAAQNFRNSSALDDNNSLKLNSRGKVKSSPNFSSNRPSGNLEAISVTKRTVFKSVEQEGASKPSSKTCLYSSFNKENLKQTPEVTAQGDCFSKYTIRTGNKSHEARPEYRKSNGILSKSKSFKIIESKVKGEMSERGVLKQNFARETANGNNKEIQKL
ncbi:hypothetical protein Pint_05165 [Pistacia integerrima]|uniref:Uncharacterized protein n=1 Tax=Pistacia integerrima TaxID=434235 RepID=A0ACC0Z9X7_9ROSI|nr:hypothetical protein Pint_05165 [Pistacia integerrima]